MKTVSLAALLLAAAPTLALAAGADANGDGMVTQDEFTAAYPDLSADVFTKADTNGDGSLDADEIAAAEKAGLIPAME
jgi:hypothetical protein